MKTSVKLLSLCLLIVMLAACAAPTTPPAATQPPAPTSAPVPTKAVVATTVPAATAVPVPTTKPLTAAEQWAKDNGVGPFQPKTEDWAAVEAAANKEGSVCVYANSSKIAKLVDVPRMPCLSSRKRCKASISWTGRRAG